MSLSIPASESIASTSPSTHSPFCLLFLLDGLLSLDDVRIHDALIEMNRLVYHATSSNNRKDSDSCPPIELLPKLPPNHRFKRNRIEGDVITTSTKTTLPQSLIPTTSSSDNPTTSPMLQYPSIAWKFTSVRRRTNAVSSASVQLPDAMMNNDTTTEGSDDDANNNACEEIIMLDICALLHIALDACPQLARSLSLHDGSTPLHFAASLGYVPIANVILQSVSFGFVVVVLESLLSSWILQNRAIEPAEQK